MRTRNPLTKVVLALTCIALFIALTARTVFKYQPTSHAAAQSTRAIPYTAVLQEIALKPDGTAIPSVHYIYAIRGDGSRAFETISGDPANPSSERILDFVSGKNMYIFSPRNLKSTTYDPARFKPSNWLRDPANDCRISGFPEAPQGEEVLHLPASVFTAQAKGVRTIKLAYNSATQWLALDYGCALVKDRNDFPDGSRSEKKLVSLTPGEPAPSMFEDPAGFAEVPPSRWMPPQDPKVSASVDASYHSHRPPDEAPQRQ